VAAVEDIDLEIQRTAVTAADNSHEPLAIVKSQSSHHFEFITAMPDDHRVTDVGGTNEDPLLPILSKHALEMASMPRLLHHPHPDINHDRQQSGNSNNTTSAPVSPLGSNPMRRRYSETSTDQMSSLRFLRFPEGRRREVLIPTGLTITEASRSSLEAQQQSDDGNSDATDADELTPVRDTARLLDDSIVEHGEVIQESKHEYAETTIRMKSEPQMISQGSIPIILEPAEDDGDGHTSHSRQSPSQDRKYLNNEKRDGSYLALNDCAHMKASFSHNLMVKSEKNESINFIKLEEYLEACQSVSTFNVTRLLLYMCYI
jgi:hypothetical protein